jgi:hypothetical protein
MHSPNETPADNLRRLRELILDAQTPRAFHRIMDCLRRAEVARLYWFGRPEPVRIAVGARISLVRR